MTNHFLTMFLLISSYPIETRPKYFSNIVSDGTASKAVTNWPWSFKYSIAGARFTVQWNRTIEPTLLFSLKTITIQRNIRISPLFYRVYIYLFSPLLIPNECVAGNFICWYKVQYETNYYRQAHIYTSVCYCTEVKVWF